MALGSDILANSVSSLILTGAKRLYGGFAANMKMRQAILRALDGEKHSKKTPSGIPALERVLGSGRNALTEKVAGLLRELERSAIPDALMQAILAGQSTDRIYPAFQLAYRTFGDGIEIPPQRLFAALVEAIQHTLERDVKDQALLKFSKAQSKAISEQLNRLLKALERADTIDSPPLNLPSPRLD